MIWVQTMFDYRSRDIFISIDLFIISLFFQEIDDLIYLFVHPFNLLIHILFIYLLLFY